MKIYDCPKCYGALKKCEISLGERSIYRKQCYCNNLKFSCVTNSHDEIFTMTIYLHERICMIFDFLLKRIKIIKYKDGKQPTITEMNNIWFEPDINNFEPLIQKLKTYIVFS